MMTKVTLYDLDMNEIKMRGVTWLEFTPEPPDAEFFIESVYNSEEVLGKASKSRLINVRFMFESGHRISYKLLRNEIFSILSPMQTMWAVDNEIPGIKWRVDVNPGSLSIERINGKTAEASMAFYSRKAYARSLSDSLDPYTYAEGTWSYGMNLPSDASLEDYIHNTTSFSIYNPGDAVIDPREHELQITFNYSGTSVPSMKIINDTTGDAWEYTGPLASGDTIILDGVKSERNLANIVGDTNLKLLTLAKGLNNFRITGLNGSFEISFKFPFLYV